MEFTAERHLTFGEIISQKSAAVMRMFGIDLDRLKKGITHKCSIVLEPGNICYITGASGAGKSVLLREFEKAATKAKTINLNEIKLANDKTVVDCFNTPLPDVMRLLSIVGLSDVFTMVNVPARLSAGQQYRFKIAMAMASGKEIIFADEFCSNLDRITAAVIAFSVRKYVNKHKVSFFAASSHDDIIGDLEPDVLIIKKLDGTSEIVNKTSRRGMT